MDFQTWMIYCSGQGGGMICPIPSRKEQSLWKEALKRPNPPKAQPAGIYCSVNRSLPMSRLIEHTVRSHLQKSQSFFCHVPAFDQGQMVPQSRGKHWDTVSKYWKAQLSLFCIVFHWFVFTVLSNNTWAKKDCSLDNSVRMETAWVRVWGAVYLHKVAHRAV